MKIKEVIERTGLTDRAIRLYIENGLVAPENQKGYTGRNNFRFSENDIRTLQQIALLRKADFSIEQIKALFKEDTEAKRILCSFIMDKKAKLETDEKVLSALCDILDTPTISVSLLCSKIEGSLRSKPVPESDLKQSRQERVKRIIFIVLSILLGVLTMVLPCIILAEFIGEFPFPKFYSDPIHYLGLIGLVLPFCLLLVVFFLHIKPKSTAKKQENCRKISILFIAAALLLTICPLDMFLLWIAPPVYGETNDPANYLQLGTCEQKHQHDICLLFPSAIPRSAVSSDAQWYPPDSFPETTKYYALHTHAVDSRFDIYAQWQLPEAEYNAEKARIETLYSNTPMQQVFWGDWVCMNYTRSDLGSPTKDPYYYLIFAYNDTTSTVRYIATYAEDSGNTADPYFVNLPWE